MNIRNVRPCRQRNPDRLRRPAASVVLGQPLADLARGAPHNRVLVRVVIRIAVEHFDSDRPLLQGVDPPLGRLLHHVTQE